jgi:hypothetical protein
MAADKAYWKNYGKPGYKSGGEIFLEETPSNPSELRQYIEVVGVFSEDITSNDITLIYQEAVNLLDYWEKERPGNLDLIRAREKLKVVTKRVKKDKRETPIMLSVIIGGAALFIASLIIFPGWAEMMKNVFWIEYIKSWILSIFSLFTL